MYFLLLGLSLLLDKLIDCCLFVLYQGKGNNPSLFIFPMYLMI